MDIHEFREIGHEPARDEAIDHELDQTRGSLHTLEPAGRQSGTHADKRKSEKRRTPAKSSLGLIEFCFDISCMPQQQITRRQ